MIAKFSSQHWNARSPMRETLIHLFLMDKKTLDSEEAPVFPRVSLCER